MVKQLSDRKIVRTIKQVDYAVDRSVAVFRILSCIVILVFLTMLLFQVIMRFVFNSPVYGLDEAVTALMVWSMAFGVPVVYWERGHAMIEFLYKKLRGIAKFFIGVISHLVILASCYVFIPGGINLFRLQNMQLPVGGLPFNRAYYHALPMIVFGILSVILALFRLVEYVIVRDEHLLVRSEEEGGALYE